MNPLQSLQNHVFWALPLTVLLCSHLATAGTSSVTCATLSEPAFSAAIQSGAEFSLSATDIALKPGQSGSVSLTLKALGAFKVNDKYPTKVTVEAPTGVTVPAKLTKADGKLVDDKTLTFQLPVKATSTGQHKLTLNAKFSVCTEAQCLMKKQTVTAQVTVR